MSVEKFTKFTAVLLAISSLRADPISKHAGGWSDPNREDAKASA